MNVYKCAICGKEANSLHHILFKSQNKALIKCKLNLIPLCNECHKLIHKKDGAILDLEYKLILQNRLEILFIKRYLTIEELQELLEINEKASRSLVRGLKIYKEGYKREDVIEAIMGKFYISE